MEAMTDAAINDLSPVVGVRAACDAVGVPQATWYRRHRQSPPRPRPAPIPHRDRAQPRALTEAERQAILTELHSDRFADLSPTEVWATLLDEGRYLGSTSTFYRLLRQASGTRERRRQATHPATVKPELAATAPNQVWSWDITKLRGPQTWSWFYLYVIIDIYSRYVVGWMVAHRESAELAEVLIRQTVAKQGITRDQLTIHADRGSSMTSKLVAFLLADLGITQSHSRPHVSDDNPFSEAQFKTLKYQPDFPGRFATIEAARAHCVRFFGWYNDEHRHTGIALHTAADVHYGLAEIVRDKRAGVLDTAYATHPERFVRKPPRPPELPTTSVDQPTPNKGDRSVNPDRTCLNQVDRFRIGPTCSLVWERVLRLAPRLAPTPDREKPDLDPRRDRARPLERTHRVGQHQDPTHHPDRLRLPISRRPHRPSHAQPRRSPTRTSRPDMTHGSVSRAHFGHVLGTQASNAPLLTVSSREHGQPVQLSTSATVDIANR